MSFGLVSFIKQLKEKNPVTVIIPVYNRRSYLDNALVMLKAQTLANIKFIIVDDGSNDGCYEYLKEAVKDDNRFMLLRNNKNRGPSVARNKALKLVHSKYVGFFDIDDEIPADYFEKLYAAAEQSQADIVFSNYNDTEHRLDNVNSEYEKYQVLEHGEIWDKLYSSALLKKHDIKFAEKLYTADNLFNVQAFHFANKIELIKEPRYIYELHDDSIGKSATAVNKRKKDIITVCKKIIDFANDNRFGIAELLMLSDFLRRSYDCYYDDADFRGDLFNVLQNCGIKLKALKSFMKPSAEDYELVKISGYFDKKYYRWHHPSLWFYGGDLLKHYLNKGWLEDKNPCEIFDGKKYLSIYRDVAASGMNPLVHYVRCGSKSGMLAFPVGNVLPRRYYAAGIIPRINVEYSVLRNSEYFNRWYYRLHNPSLLFRRQDSLEHYLTVGWVEGRNPSAKFNTNKYLAVHRDVERAGINPVFHYIMYGKDENRECFAIENTFFKPVKNTLHSIRYAFEYPMRVKEEYDRLVVEIKALENMK